MKKSVVLGRNVVLCPCCGHKIVIDATVRLKGEPKVELAIDDDRADAIHGMIEEAERHG